MKKIDQLLQAISYTNEVISNNLDFEYIKINNDTKEMELVFSSNTPLKIDDIKEFVTIIDKKESPIFAKTPRVTYHFSINSFSDEDVLDYFELIIDLLSNKNPRMTQILSYSKRYDSIKKEITVEVPYDDTIVSFSRFKGISINIEKGLDPVPTKDLIKKIRKEIEVDALKQIQNKDQYVTLYENRVFIGDEAKIDDIPTTEGELIELKGVREKINYIIEGKVVFIDSERMQRKDRPSISFIVYDGTNSIMCVRTIFTTNYKEEVAFFSELSLNQKVILQGYPEYNEFYKEVQLKVVNIRRTKISYDITNRRDNAEIPRVELHLHTKMSAQDAIPTMTDYYNAAKLFNHKAIAVTDHFSVQSYHELYELTKDKSIKPLYGLELNFVDEDEIKINDSFYDIVISNFSFIVIN